MYITKSVVYITRSVVYITRSVVYITREPGWALKPTFGRMLDGFGERGLFVEDGHVLVVIVELLILVVEEGEGVALAGFGVLQDSSTSVEAPCSSGFMGGVCAVLLSRPRVMAAHASSMKNRGIANTKKTRCHTQSLFQVSSSGRRRGSHRELSPPFCTVHALPPSS